MACTPPFARHEFARPRKRLQKLPAETDLVPATESRENGKKEAALASLVAPSFPRERVPRDFCEPEMREAASFCVPFRESSDNRRHSVEGEGTIFRYIPSGRGEPTPMHGKGGTRAWMRKINCTDATSRIGTRVSCVRCLRKRRVSEEARFYSFR